MKKRRTSERFKVITLENFLPEEHVEYFRNLRIGSKKVRRIKLEWE